MTGFFLIYNKMYSMNYIPQMPYTDTQSIYKRRMSTHDYSNVAN